MYVIYTRPTEKAKASIDLQRVKELSLPGFVLAGIGDRKKKYRDYLERCFKDDNMLKTLAQVHRLGQERGHIALLSSPRAQEYHGEVLKQFLIDNQSFLDTITPYLLNSKAPSALNGETTETPNLVPSNQVPPQLSEEDVRQIKSLIEQDQANHKDVLLDEPNAN